MSGEEKIGELGSVIAILPTLLTRADYPHCYVVEIFLCTFFG
jgi:hypothetical protein